MRRRPVVPVAAALTVALCLAAPAFAQRANGPYAKALGVQADVDQIQGLDFIASFFGAYDRNTFPESVDTSLLDPRLKQSGPSGGAAASLFYDRRGDRTQFHVNALGTMRDYAASPDLAAAYQARTSLTTKVSPKIGFTASGSASYSPFYLFGSAVDSAPDLDRTSIGTSNPGFGFAVSGERNASFDATVGVTGNLSKRTSLEFTSFGRDWQMLDSPENDLRSWGSRAGIRQRVSRGLGLHLEYGREQQDYAGVSSEDYTNETIDAGVDYGDTLVFSRRTSLSFSTSTTATRYSNETHYRVNGFARLTRGFNRTWSSWLAYNRRTEFNAGFHEPLLSDNASGGLSGLFSWRLKGSIVAGYTRGTVGFGSAHYNSYVAASRVDVALSRVLLLYGQYGYRHLEVPPGSSDVFLVPRSNRQVASVGLSLTLPLINDLRPPKEPQRP